MLGPSVLTWVTCTGAILGLLELSPEVSSSCTPAEGREAVGGLGAAGAGHLHVRPHSSRVVPRSGQIHTAPQTDQEPSPRFGRGSRQHSLSSLCTGDTPSWSCLFICKLSNCTGRDLANMGLHNAVCTESHIRAGAC